MDWVAMGWGAWVKTKKTGKEGNCVLMKNQKIKSNSKKGENRKRRHKADRKNN